MGEKNPLTESKFIKYKKIRNIWKVEIIIDK